MCSSLLQHGRAFLISESVFRMRSHRYHSKPAALRSRRFDKMEMSERNRIGIGYNHSVCLMPCQIRTIFSERHTVTFQQNRSTTFSTERKSQRLEKIPVAGLCKDPYTLAPGIKHFTDEMGYEHGGSTRTTRFGRQGQTFYYIAVESPASDKIVIGIKQTGKIPDSPVESETGIRQKGFDTFRDTGSVQIKSPDFHIVTLR